MPIELVDFIKTEDKQRWDAFVASMPGGAFCQLSAWGEVKMESGWQPSLLVALQDGQIVAGMQVFRRPLLLGLFLIYVPYGPVVLTGHEEALGQLFEEVKQRNSQAVMVKVEPYIADNRDRVQVGELARGQEEQMQTRTSWQESLKQAGFERSGRMLQPEATLILDLSQSEEELLAAMRQTTRRYIRQAERAGLVVTEDTEAKRMDEFYASLMAVNQRKQFGIHAQAYYQKIVDQFGLAVRLFFVELDGEVLGSYFLIQIGTKAWELYGGVTEAGVKLKANYLLKWRSIQAMKAAGVVVYDQWGIAPEAASFKFQVSSDEAVQEEGRTPEKHEDGSANIISSSHPLAGVTYFKQGFGGEPVEWLGSWDWTARPLLYRLLQLTKKI